MNNTTSNLVQALFYQRENDLFHLPYDNELAFYDAVKTGDINKVKTLMLPLTSTGLGHLSDEPSRNLKYHFIITTAFITRFCIEGGMDSEVAYTISDLYIQRADVCNSCEEIKSLHKEMVYDLTNRMRNLKHKNIYSKNVAICIDYIDSHLHTRINITDLAIIVKLNPNYLCTLFKKETGITLSRYIRLQRIKTSMNLLKYSDYTCLDIANFLSFSSHSHFINIFKKEVGMTPLEYRNKHFRHKWSRN
ncbi:MAG: AraC family transcriptional regulator [Eubacteriales bacterium]